MKEIKIYTTNFCPYCVMAKNLLTKENLVFSEISLQGQQELRERLSRENAGWRTVPMIFIGEEFIGGFQDLSKLHDSGGLLKKVQA